MMLYSFPRDIVVPTHDQNKGSFPASPKTILLVQEQLKILQQAAKDMPHKKDKSVIADICDIKTFCKALKDILEKKGDALCLNLAEAELQGADLSDSLLLAANLDDAKLQGATLLNTHLQGASLRVAMLQGATLGLAQLQGVDGSYAKFTGSMLTHSQLQLARMYVANFTGADVSYAKLQESDLCGTQMIATKFGKVEAQGTCFMEANLCGATFDECNLTAADFTRAKLTDASFAQSFFLKTKLEGATWDIAPKIQHCEIDPQEMPKFTKKENTAGTAGLRHFMKRFIMGIFGNRGEEDSDEDAED